jgi:hypothetical protein
MPFELHTMAVDVKRSESLDTLPDETLLHIIRWVSPGKNRHRICYVLGRINRRLHTFAMPLLLRRIRAPRPKHVLAIRDFFLESGIDYARYVQYVHIINQTSSY